MIKVPPSLLFSALLIIAGSCFRLVAAPDSLTISNPETAGMSMFRAHWDEPIPLAEGGPRDSWKYKNYFDEGRGQYAVWSKERRGDQPGAIAFDALNRSVLVRFPEAAEKIAAELAKGGRKIAKVEILLPFADEELFPPAPQPDRPGPDSYDFKGTFGTFEAWLASRPTWHAIAFALRKPWKADEDLGPTFNAAINGSLYWSRFGATDPENDRFPERFGPAEVSYRKPEGRLDVTDSLTNPEFGATLAERLRRFSDNGFLIQKWETYDHRYFNGVYEAPTATGGRAILINTPQLVVTFEPGNSEPLGTLKPAADIAALSKQFQTQGGGGKPTAVMPSPEQIQEWASVERLRPAWADDTQWQRILELFAIRDGEGAKDPFWMNFLPPHLVDPLRGARFQDGQKVFDRNPTPEETYAVWVDKLIGRPVRGWSGFEVAREWSEWMLAKDILPGPAQDAVKRYWTSWLMPDRKNSPDSKRKDITYLEGPLVHPMVEHPGITRNALHPDPTQGRFDAYWQATGDWRGNKSFYRSGFNYDISTQNFNTTASVGSFVFSQLIGADLAFADGKHGVNKWLVQGWVWSDGSGQEHFDHYYYAITLAGLKTLQNAASDPDSRLLADGLVTKGVEEAIAAWHPNLKRFIAPASRTSLEFLLGTQDGGNFAMHTMSKKGVLTDLGKKTLPGNIPVIGHEVPPSLAAQLTLPAPWAERVPAGMVDNKPLPWEAVHWGSGTWRKVYMGQNYGLAAQLTGGPRIQGMAQWRRAEADVTSALDLGTLDIRGGVNETRWVNDAGGWIKQHYKQVLVQGRNAMLALMNPVGVAGTEGIKSIQYSLGLFDIRESGPTWEIYVDGAKVESLPISVKHGQKIVIRDGVTFLGILPIPATDLGRDAEVVIEKGSPQKYEQYKADVGAALVINSYIYKKAEDLPKDIDPWSVRSAYAGYALQFSDATETSFEKFLSEVQKWELSAEFNPEDRVLKASWKNGSDIIQASYEAVPASGANSEALAKFDPKQVSATKNGKSLYPEKTILRDTPVTQMAWDRAEKGGAVATASLGRGHRLFLQSFPDQGFFTYWNPQGVPTDLNYSVPGGITLTSDGLIGLCRIEVDTRNKKIRINHVSPDGREGDPSWGAATVFMLEGVEPSYAIELNGSEVKQPLTTVTIQGAQRQILPITEKQVSRSPQEIESQLKLLDAAKRAKGEAAEELLFTELDFAGPFPVEDGVYGPEKTPGDSVQRTQAFEDGVEGQVRWKNYGLLLPDSKTLVKGPGEGYPMFNHQKAPSKAPCTYYLAATIRSDRAQDVGLQFFLEIFPEMSPKSTALWINGQKADLSQGRSGTARLALKEGENQLLIKVVQESPREERAADKATVRLGDPVYLSPILSGVEWKTAKGDWIPVNPRKTTADTAQAP